MNLYNRFNVNKKGLYVVTLFTLSTILNLSGNFHGQELSMMCMWTTGINFHNFPTHDVFFIHVSAAGPKDAGETRQNVTYASFFDRNVSFPCSFCPSHKSMILKQNPLHEWYFQSQLEWVWSIWIFCMKITWCKFA